MIGIRDGGARERFQNASRRFPALREMCEALTGSRHHMKCALRNTHSSSAMCNTTVRD